ncbi:hypothetical protein [Pseudomonas congelans]|uniref:Uncharacterized protein n=1 Tax=Pseudomonas syringae TaxID=317 RepID=A9QS38_PSESX|nr:hypothetical protein [Pseudomonas congelans]ABX64467.1 hypothetical protein [Pseudomonas syringae]
MQAQHIIILVGIGVCFVLLTVFIVRAIKRAISRSYLAGKSAGIADSDARIAALKADIATLARDREPLLLSIELKDLAIEHLKEQLSSGNTGSLTKADKQSEPVKRDVLSSCGSWCKTVSGHESAFAAEQRGFKIEPYRHAQYSGKTTESLTGKRV